jgi:hypothetical protein
MSPNFVFLVLGMTIFSFSELTVIAFTAALVQSLWRAKRPRLVQVTFSAAALVLSAILARQSAYLWLGHDALNSLAPFVILAGTLYFCFNTALVSGVIGPVEGKPFEQCWLFASNKLFRTFSAASSLWAWSAIR